VTGISARTPLLVAQPSRSAVRSKLFQIGPLAPGLTVTLRTDVRLKLSGLKSRRPGIVS
jgi:hypothetical protein